ncbi:MAG TPA: hypothetical protein VML96_09970 [Egibacteraceae bacterium]|nr:hypothetical protein [Egibacteraceae bacterium]
MSPTGLRLYRLVLLAYPAEFRRTYGEPMAQTFGDRLRDGDVTLSRLMLTEAFDAARAAPLMRWESRMNRTIIIVAAATVAVAASIAAGPMALILIAPIALAAALWWTRQNQPVASASASRRWMVWLAAGLAALGTGIGILATAGGELSAAWWTVMAASLLAGIAMTIIGIILGLDHRSHRPSAPTTL